MTQPYPPLPPPPPQPQAKPPKRRRMIPLWVFILSLAGMMFASCGVGVAAGSTPTEPVAEVTSASGANSAELDRREKTLEERNEELNQRHRELLDREEALDKRAAELDQKEQKKAEQEAANTIPGEGVYVVGRDVDPGTYGTAGPSGTNTAGCYYAFKDGAGAGADILDNNIINGRGTVTLEDGQIFETSGCQDWKRR